MLVEDRTRDGGWDRCSAMSSGDNGKEMGTFSSFTYGVTNINDTMDELPWKFAYGRCSLLEYPINGFRVSPSFVPPACDFTQPLEFVSPAKEPKHGKRIL